MSDLDEIISESRAEIVQDYKAYRRSYRRQKPNSKNHMLFEEFSYEWAKEADEDARDYTAHIRSMSALGRSL